MAKRFPKRFARGIHHGAHTTPRKAGKHCAVGIGRQPGGQAARQHQCILRAKGGELLPKRRQCILIRAGPRAVDLGLTHIAQFYIDARHAALQMDHICLHAHPVQLALHGIARKARQKAQRGILYAEAR